MLSFTHILLLGVIGTLIWGPTRIPQLGRTLGLGVRNFKKAMHGEDEIDVTDSVKRIDE